MAFCVYLVDEGRKRSVGHSCKVKKKQVPVSKGKGSVVPKGAKLLSMASESQSREIHALIMKSFLWKKTQHHTRSRIRKIRLVHNPRLETKFREKSAQMTLEQVRCPIELSFCICNKIFHWHLQGEEPAEMFCFALENDSELGSILHEGPRRRLALVHWLGHNELGLRLWRHADVCLRLAAQSQLQLHLMVYRVLLGRSKRIPLQSTTDSMQALAPTLGWDCHMPDLDPDSQLPLRENAIRSQVRQVISDSFSIKLLTTAYQFSCCRSTSMTMILLETCCHNLVSVCPMPSSPVRFGVKSLDLPLKRSRGKQHLPLSKLHSSFLKLFGLLKHGG